MVGDLEDTTLAGLVFGDRAGRLRGNEREGGNWLTTVKLLSSSPPDELVSCVVHEGCWE